MQVGIVTKDNLMRQLQNGNRAAVGDIFSKYYDDVYRYCYHHTGDQNLAEDLTQDTFTRVLDHIENYRQYGKFLNYLYVIAGNLCKDYYKKHKPVYMEEIPETMESTGAINNDIEKIHDKIVMDQAMRQMDNDLREIIILRYYRDLRISDIAKIQGISKSLVRYRIQKALDLLKENMGGNQK